MKFRYQYRTKENEVCCGEIAAADRDAAYAELRAKGIKASRMEEAPGFFNKLFGKGKRWLGIAVLGIACVVLWFVLENTKEELVDATRIEDAAPRHQIYGDPELTAKFSTYDGLVSIFGNKGDALLACFAQPGKIAEVGKARDFGAVLEESLKTKQQIVPEDSREVKELKQVVNWLRNEMLAYANYAEDQRPLRKKLESYYGRLIQRVANEKRVYDMVERELKTCTDDRIREEKNAKLRKLGLPPIMSEEK